MNLDEFEEIKGFPQYKINRNGDIWSRHYKKIMSPQENDSGYLCISLKNLDGKKLKRFIARLLALQYIENDDPLVKTQVNHKNHIRTDNRLENLEWVRQSGDNSNTRDKIKKAEGSICLDRHYWKAQFSFYSEGGLKGERIVETFSSVDKSKCEEWLENIKKDPLQYRAEKIEMKERKEEEEVALVMEKMIKKIEKENEIPLTHSEYCKKWRESHKEELKVKFEENKEEILEKRRTYASENKDKIREQKKRKYEENKDEIRAKYRAEYDPATSYYARNKEKIKADYDANKEERNRKQREKRKQKKEEEAK